MTLGVCQLVDYLVLHLNCSVCVVGSCVLYVVRTYGDNVVLS